MPEPITLDDWLALFHRKDGWGHQPKPRKNKPMRVFELVNGIRKKENVQDADLVLVVKWLHANWERYSCDELFRRATMEARWAFSARRDHQEERERMKEQKERADGQRKLMAMIRQHIPSALG